MNRAPLTVMCVYNRYLNRGGEDEVFEAEAALLEHHGCRVLRVEEQAQHPTGLVRRAAFVANSLWSRRWQRQILHRLHEHRPDVVHVHNWFPTISPAIYYACAAANVPVVQTLHNYRLFCPAAIFFRDGHVCEDCLGKTLPWPGIVHACYHDSVAHTASVAAILAVHHALKTWQQKVDLYICLTEFSRQKFMAGGLPPAQLFVKPNFVHPDPGIGDGREGYALFVGRLAPQKGVETLLAAWSQMGDRIPLKIAGDGPLADTVKSACRQSRSIEYLGLQPRPRVLELMKGARLLIFPSLWYEAFALTIIEALAVGLPVVASHLGSMATLIEHGRTGLHFRPNDPADLAAQVGWVLEHPAELHRMRHAARAAYEQHYTAESNYHLLLQAYQLAAENHARRHR